MSDTLILIPARMASTRLPGKPLAEIHGKPMIAHVVERALEADLGSVCVATDSKEVYEAVHDHGAAAVMTRQDHNSGSDRIWEALEKTDREGAVEFIVNLQGDLPTIDRSSVVECLNTLRQSSCDISTLATEIVDESERINPNVVKAIGTPIGQKRYRALYFTRATAPYGEGPLYHHIGIYAYKRAALHKFVTLPPSELELREKLEQLRALEAGMRIDIALVDTVPLGVDTPEDLEEARTQLAAKSAKQ